MRNPTRRNRNIGTNKQGYGKFNSMVIPDTGIPFVSFVEHLKKYETFSFLVNGINFTIVVEETQDGIQHACSPNDIRYLLPYIPMQDIGELRLIVFRQPTKKQQLLSPVWGRLVYSFDFEGEYQPAIVLEAQNLTKSYKWTKFLSPENQLEFQRLLKDGHQITETKRHFIIQSSLESIRNTQLYRTFFHEWGHYVQFLRFMEGFNEEKDEEAYDHQWRLYHKIPKQDKEAFAHRYATKLKEALHKQSLIPFSTQDVFPQLI